MDKSTAFSNIQEELKKRDIKEPVFGLDLGTTNSCIAVVQQGKVPTVIRLTSGRTTMPSCILWKGKDEFVVGLEAYKERYKPNAKYSVKTMMGSDEKVVLRYNKKEKVMTPEEVSAEIIKGIVKQASDQFKDIKTLVISLPAYFSSSQVEATINAGKLAGMNVIGITREPTAAAINYGMTSLTANEETMLVYDLGGGTFDVSLIRITKTSKEDLDALSSIYEGLEEDAGVSEQSGSVLYSVISVDGDSHLGGDDIDKEFLKIVEEKLANEHKILPSLIQRQEKEKLLLELEKIKKNGVGTYVHTVTFRLLNGEKKKVSIEISPEDFTRATKTIYNKTKVIVDRVLANAKIEKPNTITLVGGSTKSPIIQGLLAKDFPDIQINSSMNPDEAVAAGAAIYAKELQYGDSDISVFEVVPRTIGLYINTGVTPLIHKNKVLPCEVTETFTTLEDDQEFIDVHLMEGESRIPEECDYINSVRLTGFKKGKAGEVAVPVTLKVDSNGVLTVTVRVGDKSKTATLVNLLGRDHKKVTTMTASEKKINRWKRFANTLSEENKELLLGLIEQHLEGDIDQDEIVKFIDFVSPQIEVDTSEPAYVTSPVMGDE